MTQENNQQFDIQRIYVKDLSFEAPHLPGLFKEEWKPHINVDLNTSSHKLEENIFDVELTVTVTAKLADKTAFLVEAKQAGIFTIANFDEEQQNQILGSFCPNLLFPYARELISETIIRGGFPPLYLAPINFEALYQEQLAQKQAK